MIAGVNNLLNANPTGPNADVSKLESEIDQVLYSLYNHTAEVIAMVEENTI